MNQLTTKKEKFIINEDFSNGFVEIDRAFTLKEALDKAKKESIKRINSIYVSYDKDDSSFLIGYDPTGTRL